MSNLARNFERIPIGDVKPNLGSICKHVELDGIEVILTKHGKDMVRICPLEKKATKDYSGFLKNQLLILKEDILDTKDGWKGMSHDEDHV